MLQETQVYFLARRRGGVYHAPPAQRHHAWPYLASYLYCPRDKRVHLGGCSCARHLQHLIPGSLRDWYRRMWQTWH